MTFTSIPLTKDARNELARRKSKCSWETKRPNLTWDQFLLECTEKWTNNKKV